MLALTLGPMELKSARRGQLQLTAEDMLAMTYIAPPTSGDDELTLQLFRGTVLLNERSITVEILPAYLLLEGFENEVGWRAGNAQDYPDAPGALRGERNNSDVSPMEGTYTYCMEVDTTQGDAVFEFLPQPPMDLSEYSTLTLDVYTPDPQVRLSLAITTGANWLWHESVIQDLPRPRDWNQLTFDLTAATYKVGSGSWDSPIRNLNIVQRLAVKIYGPQFTGKLYMDNLRGIKAEVSREP